MERENDGMTMYFVLYDRELVCKKGIEVMGKSDVLNREDCEIIENERKKQNIESLAYTEKLCENSISLKVYALERRMNLPIEYEYRPLRWFFATHGLEDIFFASRARGMSNWLRNNRYCSCCGSRLEGNPFEKERYCPTCKREIFPRIEPCIIVLVHRYVDGRKQILLARHAQRNQDVYSCLAGFMETGESAEHTVKREIMEETSIRVKNITYRGSQSWPFPCQLMLAFEAEYDGGEIKCQEEEIVDAQWFDYESLPQTPTEGSVAYRLIHNLF